MEKERISEEIAQISLLIGLRYKDGNEDLDSALIYLNKSYQLSLKSSTYSYRPNAHLRHFGEVHYKKGEKDLAMNYFRQSIANHGGADGRVYRFIAYIFRDKNQLDSAKYYAEKSYEIERKTNQPIEIFASSTLLFELFQHTNPAKALQYHLIATAWKDSIFNQNKAREIEQIALEEQEREATIQRRIEVNQITYRNKIKTYSLLAGLAIFLLIALILYLNNRQK